MTCDSCVFICVCVCVCVRVYEYIHTHTHTHTHNIYIYIYYNSYVTSQIRSEPVLRAPCIDFGVPIKAGPQLRSKSCIAEGDRNREVVLETHTHTHTHIYIAVNRSKFSNRFPNKDASSLSLISLISSLYCSFPHPPPLLLFCLQTDRPTDTQ